MSRGFVFAVSQNTTNDGGLSDESDDLHLIPAALVNNVVSAGPPEAAPDHSASNLVSNMALNWSSAALTVAATCLGA